jgi:anthranilate 1,2-dioxygenase ferredoxin component
LSGTWHKVIAPTDIPENEKHKVIIKGWHILVARIEGEFFAVNDRCSHQASTLSTGRIRRGVLMCPLHGARFEVAGGKCVGGAYSDLRTFALRVANGMIEIEVPDAAPGTEDLPIMF